MKLNVNGKSIGFFDFDYKAISTKIGISVSGGSDSAMLFYLMAKHLKGVTLQPWSCVALEDDPLKSELLVLNTQKLAMQAEITKIDMKMSAIKIKQEAKK